MDKIYLTGYEIRNPVAPEQNNFKLSQVRLDLTVSYEGDDMSLEVYEKLIRGINSYLETLN
ncbi:UDP-N-acetylglucosamine enolpyruvyl transferase [Paenibacillus popilliae ATCC 14706]|uniref:UDP-N-acetylglucosamine enolpyruvyl transferase n=1 Tax=Paenibacillus popilliae ATCC 14706 TaxID=1212764 RepID=M9M5W2_PAEPP|nr:UDP-N-acetylglucosamine enolpyruvyl transferase [Paenibacillus popilliae ATCC 14706]